MVFGHRTAFGVRAYRIWCTAVSQMEYGRIANGVRCENRVIGSGKSQLVGTHLGVYGCHPSYWGQLLILLLLAACGHSELCPYDWVCDSNRILGVIFNRIGTAGLPSPRGRGMGWGHQTVNWPTGMDFVAKMWLMKIMRISCISFFIAKNVGGILLNEVLIPIIKVYILVDGMGLCWRYHNENQSVLHSFGYESYLWLFFCNW